jgi:hypothetical protein
MQAIPPALQTKFEDHLRSKGIPDPLLWSYRKWIRYYLDYCEKYHFSPRDQNSLPRFIGKLREKKQTEQQQIQAAEAIKLYYEVVPVFLGSGHGKFLIIHYYHPRNTRFQTLYRPFRLRKKPYTELLPPADVTRKVMSLCPGHFVENCPF